MWDKCSTAFLAKFFPLGKTNGLRGRISCFQQTGTESIPEAWERLQEYILACLIMEWTSGSYSKVSTMGKRQHPEPISMPLLEEPIWT